MNKITKRIVAGASAVALLASAVGIDRLAELFVKTSYAVGVGEGKTAKSTGFNNLEQDTDSDGNYNTGYGLHTNKTATALADGRTFDVNLESWYVGENPVDVATILDASGSMAWTVNTLDPLSVSAQLSVDDKNYLSTNYGTENLAAIQEKHEGYLPQDVVDLILDKNNTDNTKLSYAGYKYYVYEDRSSVSEFVPLGYWDGGEETETFEPIGYYPFDGTLENKAKEGATATYIQHAATGASFDEKSTPIITPNGVFKNKALDLKATAQDSAILLDVHPTSNKFKIEFEVSVAEVKADWKDDNNSFDETPIMYIGSGDDTSSYYRIVRGSRRPNKDKGKDGAAAKFRVYDSITTQPTTNTKTNGAVDDDKSLIDATLFNTANKSYTCTLTFDGKSLKFEATEYEPKKDKDTGAVTDKIECTLTNELDYTKGVNLIIGGNPCAGKTNYSDVYVKNVKVYDETNTLIGNYPLEENLSNNASTGKSATVIEQANGLTFDTNPIADTPATVKYADGNSTLNLVETGKNGAILLDATPNSNNYTLSFKMKIKKGSANPTENQNIIYVGDGSQDTNKYQSIYRRDGNSSNHIGILDYDRLKLSQYLNGGTSYDDEWATITVTVKGKTAKVYVDGKQEYKSKHSENNDSCYWETEKLTELNAEQMKIILAGLWDPDTYKNAGEIYLDDVYVFNETLDAGQVAAVANATEGQTEFAKLPDKLSIGCKGYHATTKIDGKDVDIAQIKDTLAQNPNDEERRGWYYVNSHSKWEDIEGCLASGKQYIGIYDKDKDNGIENVDDAGKDTATIPSGADSDLKTAINAGNTNTKKFNKAPENERSIRFYVDSQNHLRCFAWSGSTSKDGDIRTFCSLVYEKGYNDDDNSEQITKYEELNNALNTFYQKIAEKSDLSNNAVVRFSTNSAVATITKEDKTEDQINAKINTTNTNLQKLIMKDWTNWSDYYQTDMKAHEGTEGYEPKTTDYLKDLLIPAEGETALGVNNSAITSGEYPYVMTGGTYTWTGLKAFYDNMVKNEDSQTAKDIANDARDKYLIIFTDGRDNTQDYNVSELDAKANYTNYTDKMAGSPVYNSGSNCKGTKYVNDYNPYADDPTHKVGFSIKNYNNHWTLSDTSAENLVQKFVTEDHEIASDGDLAEAWADKLKDEGYTIYCVMMASGSISPTANADEYNKAKNFLKSLSGSNELDAQIAQMQADNEKELNEGSTKPDGLRDQQKEIEALRDKYVIVVDPTADDAITVTGAFEQILEQIQLPRNDYTVQDYIDPRFDLIGEAYVDGNDKPQEVIYHLGANGEITFTDTNNNKLAEIQVKVSEDTKVTLTSGTAVGNIIDNITSTRITSLPYTPIESYMVNRKADSSYDDGYDTGNIGTGYIYYDNVKDMYYLRWTDQIIPMKNKSFDTKEGETDTYLDVWSATIRLKAKDDFIGGNNILTNGNEAGENLVYSDATIENMDKGENYKLYGFTDTDLVEVGDTKKVPYRKKLEALSGTDRKINAVDAGGVSQAVYGNGIDIPSSGFPRTTVNVRLLPLNANNLNDVIYMGEVVSPTMMLADLENGYMTGSYYLQYLERYAYRLYGEDATKQPLLELLNQWLKINITTEESKTFTIPYIYLPDPEYDKDGEFTAFANSTGADKVTGDEDIYEDLNLRDVTGFITYTWKRNDDGEEQQKTGEFDASGNPEYDVTIDYVVKNTKQIKYNLQLTFTPLKEEDLPEGFSLGENFIENDKFFTINENGEFIDSATTAWTITKDINSNRTDYLKAMIKEEHTYTPHIEYDTTKQKWKLLSGGDEETKDVYDWDKDYKKVVGNAQLEGDLKLYTSTTDNVNFADADGVKIEGTTATAAPVSLAANTTYTKDVVNAALALELFVDGKYLNKTDSKITDGKEFTFEATRYYDDPIDPLPYDTAGTSIGADTSKDGKKYRLTFTVDEIPTGTKSDEIYRVWAKLTKVEVENSDTGGTVTYEDINNKTSTNLYAGYDKIDALPIGTYVISVKDTEMNDTASQYYLGEDEGAAVYFKYLKVDTDSNSYEHSKFPENVYQVSESAADSTEDGEYQIWNTTTDYSKKNIAESNRTKDAGTQTATFYFGTVKDGSGDKGVSVKDYLKENPEATSAAEFKNDYAKDRLGIIMLSADNNSLAITKEVKNYKDNTALTREWEFTVTVKPDADDDVFGTKESETLNLKWYTLVDGEWKLDETSTGHDPTITFTKGSDGTYTATIKLKHGEKVVISGLPEGKWQVSENVSDFSGTPHNDQSGYDDGVWQYQNAASTLEDIELNPASQVNYINEFPYELPSAGGSGTLRFVLFGTLLTTVGAMLFAVLYYDRRKRARK